ncbi:hypothetical protein F2P79_013299 [Pimephales promelas]|nr:hypothetical protein F2P79_013299 [Pimephales promelas]
MENRLYGSVEDTKALLSVWAEEMVRPAAIETTNIIVMIQGGERGGKEGVCATGRLLDAGAEVDVAGPAGVWCGFRFGALTAEKKSNEQEPGDSRLFLTQFRGCLGSSDNPRSGIPLLSL